MSSCADDEVLAPAAVCPNHIPAEWTPCEPGLVCTYFDPLGCAVYFRAVCNEQGVWEYEGRCIPDGGPGGGGGEGGHQGGTGGLGGEGGSACIDAVVGPPLVISAVAQVFAPDTGLGTYMLEFSEPVSGVVDALSWSGAGELASTTVVDAQTYRVRFANVGPGESATLSVGTTVADDCGNSLDGPVPIALSLYPSCHYLDETFEGDFMSSGWSTVDHAADGNVWARNDQLDPPTGVPNHTDGSGLCASANDEATAASSAWDTDLVAPTIDLSSAASVLLRYQSDFQDQGGDGQAWLEASSDGSSWDLLSSWTDDRGPSAEAVDLSAYAGGTVTLRWRYSDDMGSGAWWDIDEVCVQEFAQSDCSCPTGGRAETKDVDGGLDGNGSQTLAELTAVTLATAGDRVSVCGLLEDSAASGTDYHAFIVNSGSGAGSMRATVRYCIENALEDATIEIWARNTAVPLASLTTAKNEGLIDVSLVDQETHYVVISAPSVPYSPSSYSVSVTSEGTGTPILTEGFESWPPINLTITDDDTCLDWAQSDQTVVPSGYFPTEGNSLAYLNTYDCSSGSEALETVALNLGSVSSVALLVDLFHDTGYPAAYDSIQVQYDDGGGWLDIGPPLVRPAATTGWVTESVDLSALAGKLSVRLRLLGTSLWGNHTHIDNVVVLAD